MTALILHGASSPSSTLASAQQFDTLTGIRQNVVHCHFPMANGPNLNLPIPLMDAHWKLGQLFMATWGTWDLVSKIAWQPVDICTGRYDQYLHAQAKLVAAWKHPFFLRLDHEFNGSWAPWFYPPNDFVAMWQHIVEVFRQDGAHNATWVWCPNQLDPVGSASSTAADKLQAYYPGDSYVDWTGFDCYNGFSARNSSWQSWDQIARRTYDTVAMIAPTKPQIVAEFACHVGTLGAKQDWILDTYRRIPSAYPLIRGLLWFNKVDRGALWPLDAANGTAGAYNTALATGPYLTTPLTMPPDLTPIQPLQSAQLWGDPLGDLVARLGTATIGNAVLRETLTGLQGSLDAATTLHTEDTAAIDTLQQQALATVDQLDAYSALKASIRDVMSGAAETEA